MDARLFRKLKARCRRWSVIAGLGLVLAINPVAGAEAIRFEELYQLLKAKLAGVSEAQLNEAAVGGLLDQLSAKVAVVGEDSPSAAATGAAVSADVFDKDFGYLRVRRVGSGTDRDFRAAYERLRSTNSLKGLVIDLRFAGGQDYQAAVAVADQFLATDQPLVDWGEGWKRSTAKTNAIGVPVAVLVNRKTTGAAEALAGMLRHREVGLLIGTNTGGQASMTREFALKTGQRLRVAVAPLKVADGRELPFSGMKADIEVEVSAEDEQVWYADAYKIIARPSRLGTVTNDLALTGTNRPARRRINEAELVRMSREGQSPDRETNSVGASAKAPEPPTPTVNDPVLARALDLLKGLAVVQQFRSI